MSEPKRRKFKSAWGGCIVSFQVSDEVLEAAMKKAVQEDILPKGAPLEEYLTNWYKMQAILETAFEQAMKEAEWGEEVL